MASPPVMGGKLARPPNPTPTCGRCLQTAPCSRLRPAWPPGAPSSRWQPAHMAGGGGLPGYWHWPAAEGRRRRSYRAGNQLQWKGAAAPVWALTVQRWPLAHLVCKSYCQDLVWLGAMGMDEVGDARGQHPRLQARTRRRLPALKGQCEVGCANGPLEHPGSAEFKFGGKQALADAHLAAARSRHHAHGAQRGRHGGLLLFA